MPTGYRNGKRGGSATGASKPGTGKRQKRTRSKNPSGTTSPHFDDQGNFGNDIFTQKTSPEYVQGHDVFSNPDSTISSRSILETQEGSFHRSPLPPSGFSNTTLRDAGLATTTGFPVTAPAVTTAGTTASRGHYTSSGGTFSSTGVGATYTPSPELVASASSSPGYRPKCADTNLAGRSDPFQAATTQAYDSKTSIHTSGIIAQAAQTLNQGQTQASPTIYTPTESSPSNNNDRAPIFSPGAEPTSLPRPSFDHVPAVCTATTMDTSTGAHSISTSTHMAQSSAIFPNANTGNDFSLGGPFSNVLPGVSYFQSNASSYPGYASYVASAESSGQFQAGYNSSQSSSQLVSTHGQYRSITTGVGAGRIPVPPVSRSQEELLPYVSHYQTGHTGNTAGPNGAGEGPSTVRGTVGPIAASESTGTRMPTSPTIVRQSYATVGCTNYPRILVPPRFSTMGRKSALFLIAIPDHLPHNYRACRDWFMDLYASHAQCASHQARCNKDCPYVGTAPSNQQFTPVFIHGTLESNSGRQSHSSQ